jgi:phage-related protein
MRSWQGRRGDDGIFGGSGLQPLPIHLVSTYKFLYSLDMINLKPVEFRGCSLDDLRAFPLAAKREAGHQLDQIQNGQEPDDWKPMSTVGQGVKEIRIRDATGAFRIIYVAKFADAVYAGMPSRTPRKQRKT